MSDNGTGSWSIRLGRMLRPRSIAVFGGREAAEVVRQCERMGFAGEVWPVHPTRESIAGHRCYRSVDDLPRAPDAAFVGVNRHLTVEIVRDLARRGGGGVVCYASGFREHRGEGDGTSGAAGEGAELEAALLRAAGEMPIIGPNCYGIINYLDGALLWPDQHGGRRLAEGATGVAVVTQSSNIAINVTMQARGLPLAYVMTAGNQAQIGVSSIAAGLLDDPRVTAVGLHVEGFDDVRALEALAAKSRDRKKPVVVIKVGRSVEARSASFSHTASLAGTDVGSEALLRRLGFPRVNSLSEFVESLKMLHVHGSLAGFAVTSLSCSGGEASMIADAVIGTKMRFRPFDVEQRAAIQSTLSPLVTVANPLDYHTFIWTKQEAMTRTFSSVLECEFDLALLILDMPRRDRCDPADWIPTREAFEAALRLTGARGAVVASLPDNMPEGDAEALMARGVAPLCGLREALVAAESAAAVGEAWRRAPPEPLASAPPLLGAARLLDEAEGKRLLASHGVPVPEGQIARTADEAGRIADTLGYPVAVKALGVAHKTEQGAVRLRIEDRHQAERAAAALLPLGTGVLVERMVQDGVAELIVGITRDEVAGLMLTVGSGGVLVELLGDAATLLLPSRPDEIQAALLGLRSAPLLTGYRGSKPADVGTAVEAISAIARFAVAHASSLVELDVNPLIVCAENGGAFAADVLIRMED